MRDVYLHPTVTALAALAGAGARDWRRPRCPAPSSGRAQRRRHLLCGSGAAAAVPRVGHRRVGPDGRPRSEWLRRAATFVEPVGSAPWWSPPRRSAATSCCRSAAKWLLVGRCTAEEFPLWGLALPALLGGQELILRANPLAVFVGSPLYNLYLRALGARIGARRRRPHPRRSRCARTCSRSAPARSSARTRISAATGPSPGEIQTGPVTSARDVVVGEQIAARHRCGAWATVPSSGTPRRCSPGRWCRPARAGTARPPSRRDVDYRLVAARAVRAAAPVRLRAVAAAERAGPVRPARPRAGAVLRSSASRCSPRLIEPGTTTADDPAVHLQVLGYVAVLFVRRRSSPGSSSSPPSRAWCSGGLRRDAVHPLYGIRYWLHRIDRADDELRVLQRRCSATARRSCTTCGRSGTGSAGRWCRPARTSASRVQAREPVPQRGSAAGRWSRTGCRS